MFNVPVMIDTFNSMATINESFHLRVPGFKKDEISVTSKDNVLSVSGEVKRDDAVAYAASRRTNSFNYEVSINPNRKVTNVKLENGILFITLDNQEKNNKEKSYTIR